ncbi:DNA-directed RNA polymerase [Mesobacillus persicus]|uniref:DNA-directed RNA polymerase n=1 Tax=Mesobacillus persicus TaxID=930146 RepID=A0A1H8FXR6_9BACI|nr:sigma-70 family RNA polymerase sigma factor [Mesobacillus persicus]SEN36325.1 DNA-directed RNA polymerase [Mesobacillus persicus]
MESFEQVAEQYTPMIYSIIRSLNIYKNKDDYFQIGQIGLWEAYERFDPEKGQFLNYAYTYIKGKILTELKKSKNYEDHTCPASEEFWGAIEDPWTTCPLEEDILLSFCKSNQLTENQTKWVLYYCLKGFSIKEIAEIEHVSPSAVKAWRAGAKKKLIGDGS